MRYSLTIFIAFISITIHAQTFVGSIHAGDKLPDSINIGGYIEKPQKNCSCKIYEIQYKQDNISIRSKNGSQGEVLGIHYNKDSIVTGIIRSTIRFSVEDAEQAFYGQLPILRDYKRYPGMKIIKEHLSNPDNPKDFNYFAWSIKNGKAIKTYAQIEFVLTEEEYLPNSSYKPRILIKSK